MQTVEELISWTKQKTALGFLQDLARDFADAEIFFVGGALRDWFLNRSMKQVDCDFVIRNVPLDTLITRLQKHGTVDVVGKTFGVMKFRPKNSPADCVDLALPRTEQALPDSLGGYRDISVQFDHTLPIEDDLSRRDFTVNAMALNLANGAFMDPFHGKEDLEKKMLRAVGEPKQRFTEDLTRILRGLRFAVELNFDIEPATIEAMKSLVPELNHLRKTDGANTYVVPREMVGDELSKAFLANPSRTIHLLQELGVLEELFPSVWRHMQVDAHYLEPVIRSLPPPSNSPLGQGGGYALEHTIILLLRGLTPDEVRTTLSFTGLETIDKQSSRRLDTDHIAWMIQKLQQHLTPQNITAMRASHFEKQFLGARGTQHIHLLDHLGHGSVVDAAKKRRSEICTKWKCEEHEPIPSLITGDDILRQGIPAGARVREILEMVRDKQLDGHILTREAAIRFVKQQME